MQLSSLYIYLRVKCYWLNRDWKRRSGTYVGTLAHRPPGARLIKLHINPHISVKKEPSGNIQTHCRGFCSWTSIMKASLKSKGGRGMEKHSRILPTNQGDLSDWSYWGSINPLHYWVINMCWAPTLWWCSAAALPLLTQTQSFLMFGKKCGHCWTH